VGGVSYDLFETTLDDLERASLLLLDRTIGHYKPSKVWALFSGGTDSTASTLLASHHPAFSGVLHLDTETGVPETRTHVEGVANLRSWDLVVEPPRTTGYERLVRQFGFPGRGQHHVAYAHLKDRALKRLTTKKRAGGDVLLVAGARTAESVRRMSNAKLVTESGHRTWLNPILHWPKEATTDYARKHAVPPNPVSEALGMSGECLCGCYARPGERALLRRYYPAWEEWCAWLESEVEGAGKWAHWGVQAPKRLQMWPEMPEFEQLLCTDCARRAA
jgi:3'-phosphoadenosine 5'-phosphosulfate sulfotransferase (PAPS reductase)/FAD synthetase